ncbi:MAG TPA: phenylalanine--tRNA ligase subunit alpha [bacterium]
MEEQIRALGERALAALATARDEALETWRVEYLSRKSSLATLMTKLGTVAKEERPRIGALANEIKTALQAAFDGRVAALEVERRATAEAADRVDVTLPGAPPDPGRLHLTTQTLRRICGIFHGMGFEVFESPEVESDHYNFELLNMPQHHPARDMWDTFYVDEKTLLRTHTSPGQIHAMKRHHPEPFRVVLPGRVFRYEAVSARSEFMFFQVEGLAVGRNVTMAQLKQLLESFASQMYGGERRLRLRGSYFPFTEPSVEVDMDCILCGGKGCRICKGTGWLEIAGAGMIHPSVLANGGYDPAEFSGFAFGMGPERIAMQVHGIDDIRYFYSNDLRFLAQFG